MIQRLGDTPPIVHRAEQAQRLPVMAHGQGRLLEVRVPVADAVEGAGEWMRSILADLARQLQCRSVVLPAARPRRETGSAPPGDGARRGRAARVWCAGCGRS